MDWEQSQMNDDREVRHEVRIDFERALGIDLDRLERSRDRICKHMLAALLREGNERVLTALPRLIARAHTTV
jgi:hypothetical protein